MASLPAQYRLAHLPTGKTIATVRRLTGFWEKGVGVIGLRALTCGEGVWLPRVASVHTCFVRFPLDLLFLDAQCQTLRIVVNCPPWRPWVHTPRAMHTIELGTGTLAAVAARPGDAWRLSEIA